MGEIRDGSRRRAKAIIAAASPLPHLPRSLRVDFPDFARVLAHFRPVDDEDTGTRDPKEPEPLNSRMNKLRCELVGSPQVWPQICHTSEGPRHFPLSL